MLTLALCAVAPAANAGEEPNGLDFGRGKLLLTGGVASIDGAAGGGLVPWAVTAGYATEGEIGGAVHVTRLKTQDYALTTFGVALSVSDRFEASLARQQLDAGSVVPGTTLKLDVLGVKWRIAGDAVLEADSWLPQLALGAEWKHLDPGSSVAPILASVGAKTSGIDLYVSATKLFLGPGVLVNATLRATRANQNGLLGFGSSGHTGYQLQPEFSVALLLRRSVAVGLEYRTKPDPLAFAGDAFREQDWADAFIAWAPNKRISLTAAWVELGNIVGRAHQRGPYLSAQLTF
ncbi:MAG: DUF3034 family protein [Caldimonas sp.]